MYKVFLVDDEPWVLMGLKSMLNWGTHGFSIVGEASDGVSARERIRYMKPDLIISDIRMPGMSGLDLLESVQGEDLICEILLISGYADFDYAKRAIQLGVRGYLVKPIREEELSDYLKKIRRILNDRLGSLPYELGSEAGYLTEKRRVDHFITFIQENYHKQISLQTLAMEFHISESHLSNLIKKHSGKKFTEHLTELRIREAQGLLANTNDSVEEIAKMVGYLDSFYFSRVYKKHTGLSPAEFRRTL